MTETITIHDLALEMQTWLTFSPEVLEKAKNANINTSNNKAFRRVMYDWSRGWYDEDPEYVGRWIEAILEKEG